LYFSHPACLEHETGEHPERPARIQEIETELERRGWLGYERRQAPAAPLEAVTAVHAEAYVEAVRASSASRRSLDEEIVLSPGSYRAALHAAGGACAMVDALLAGEARAGFCGTRPPGHHARSAHVRVARGAVAVAQAFGLFAFPGLVELPTLPFHRGVSGGVMMSRNSGTIRSLRRRIAHGPGPRPAGFRTSRIPGRHGREQAERVVCVLRRRERRLVVTSADASPAPTSPRRMS